MAQFLPHFLGRSFLIILSQVEGPARIVILLCLFENISWHHSTTLQFDPEKRSILAVGDITEIIPDGEADVAVLEEPEHLTWYHHGRRWKTKFWRVIGVVHTNYLEYVKRERNGRLHAFLLKHANSWVVQIYCHKVIRLSAATQDLPRSIICNVHGVNPKFLEIGRKVHEEQVNRNQPFTKGVYYIGKMVWSKGYRELLQLLKAHQNQLPDFQVDLYGNGEDSDQVQEEVRKLKLTVEVNPGRDHADPLFHEYKVFFNPSTTDVVCTTTAEALAMGKIVICADHPSNDFFKQFPNCRMYKDGDEFVKVTRTALTDKPARLTDDQMHELSWEAATERFVGAAELDHKFIEEPVAPVTPGFMSASLLVSDLTKNMEDASAFVHYTASGIEAARRAFGAMPGSLQPDEEQCKELGLVLPAGKPDSKH
ncbi:digalactosyldiacylglycerol synthase 2, chloroplastic-like isoform X2 [Magnolia sinica]|uniref:digalactosyldiacylglycerol synthase 2, chloroplastic-like isoform X2 n=1 Tax=Magnolia sinica TaxID=86752 RepID=UPI0026584698|nr:digalactosyldiacylglycerol synthase 2, chloroplastic-like isoform X2 [Magnolia sinica]